MGPILSSAMDSVSLFVPNKYVFIVATGVGWYGRQFTLTYGHDLARKFVIARTEKSFGKLFAYYVIAPLTVPDVVSTFAKYVGVVAGLITILVLNTLCYCCGKWGEWRSSPDPKPADSQSFKKNEQKTEDIPKK